MIEWVQDRAIEVVDAAELIDAYLGECRQRHLVAPAKKHIDRVCRQALARARREICRRLIASLPGTDVNALEALLQRHLGETALHNKDPRPKGRGISEHRQLTVFMEPRVG